MAADLSIHASNEITEEDMRCFFSNTLGSKWSHGLGYAMGQKPCEQERRREREGKASSTYDPRAFGCKHWDKVADSDQVWVGEVSWLKAAISEDPDTYVPNVVQGVSEAIGEDLITIDDELIAKVSACFGVPNNTAKEGGVYHGEGYSTANREDVVAFLESHKGQKAFTVSW